MMISPEIERVVHVSEGGCVSRLVPDQRDCDVMCPPRGTTYVNNRGRVV